MVDGATLERLCGGNSTGGSNPPLSANVFFCCGFIEAWGRGIEKICLECDKSGNKYPKENVVKMEEKGMRRNSCGYSLRFNNYIFCFDGEI